MPSINLNGELFHYACVGEGLPFVFQHGMGADVTQPLSSGGNLAGWRMIAMDQDCCDVGRHQKPPSSFRRNPINCNLTVLFSFPQAVACAEAKVKNDRSVCETHL